MIANHYKPQLHWFDGIRIDTDFALVKKKESKNSFHLLIIPVCYNVVHFRDVIREENSFIVNVLPNSLHCYLLQPTFFFF